MNSLELFMHPHDNYLIGFEQKGQFLCHFDFIQNQIQDVMEKSHSGK
jgi:hypothetical protein